MLPELNEDVITLVIQATLCSAPIGPNLESTTRYRRRSLLPLSQACRHLREYCLPFMFREVYSTPRGIYPRSIWKYIVILHLRDRLPSSVERFDVSPYVDVLPSLVALRRLVLHVDPGITFDALLRAAGSTPHLYDLFLEDTQLAFPPLSSSPGLNHLRRLSISIATPPRNMSEDELRAELQNVHECMRTLSAHLQDLEIPADICPLRTLADHSWPQLRALVMTGHAPAYGRTTVSAAVHQENQKCSKVAIQSYKTL
ncbi:hypothetical protein PLICRDRAFT_46627 [Plicaturopsis crispa FD-325 SS-3]|uniref:Unplaced genomic scaffold PLICRscaffold_20, whole genome shotgun sequence n=1 Tax=Plicaturopsis crispa FD-325 SS-3 TaxID=944288 RepID=A0A0C9T3I8_PLICR|nr:hypothetical protein PLICRDRAFT_46627 [Plicaturopsis crispa FD-325 SS-3]